MDTRWDSMVKVWDIYGDNFKSKPDMIAAVTAGELYSTYADVHIKISLQIYSTEYLCIDNK